MSNEAQGPKYTINIEGIDHPWTEDHITVEQLRQLGSLPENEAVIEVDLDTGGETTLASDAVIALKPGMAFARKVEFKRG